MTEPAEQDPILRIWHLDAGSDPDSVDGQSTALWRLAAGQARAGHDVTLFCHAAPSEPAQALAASVGLRVVEIRRSVVKYPPWSVWRLGGAPPDLVHLHSSWVPSHAAVAAWCRRRRIPYAYSAHGGHTPALLSAGRLRRRLYVALVERPTTHRATVVIYASQAEADEAARLFGTGAPRLGLAPFPAATSELGAGWTWRPGPRPVVYLGRYDVFQKGIDGLCEIARHAPELDFDLYGTEPTWDDALADFRRVAAAAPSNARFRGPIAGAAKHAALADAGVYVQYSRFEGWPLAVTEAMACGVPVACATRLPFAHEPAAQDGAFLLSDDPSQAADQLRTLLADRDRLEDLGRRGAAFVHDRIDADAIAARHVAVYRTALRAASDK